MHSWRVLLLPFMGEDELFEQYRFEEPRDSPHNRALFEGANVGRQHLFHCPSDHTKGQEPDHSMTSYVMITGSGTISDGPNRNRPEQITDGISQTILVVEVANSGIHWAEPRDLTVEEISFRINDPKRRSISSNHPEGAHILMCDGYKYFVKDSTALELLEGMTTIAGGEDVSEFFKQFQQSD